MSDFFKAKIDLSNEIR